MWDATFSDLRFEFREAHARFGGLTAFLLSAVSYERQRHIDESGRKRHGGDYRVHREHFTYIGAAPLTTEVFPGDDATPLRGFHFWAGNKQFVPEAEFDEALDVLRRLFTTGGGHLPQVIHEEVTRRNGAPPILMPVHTWLAFLLAFSPPDEDCLTGDGFVYDTPFLRSAEAIANATPLICEKAEEAWRKRRPQGACEAEGATSNAPDDSRTEPERGTKERKRKWEARAMLLISDHPDWSDRRIAEQVGIHRSQLSRSAMYQQAKRMAQGDKSSVRKGFADPDETGGMVVDAAAAQTGPGQPVEGSKYMREYCAICNDPIRVTPDQVGKKPRCDDCQ